MSEAPRGHLLHEGLLLRRRDRAKEVGYVPEAKPKEKMRPLRVARMLALAHECEALIAAGVVADRAELASVLGFTRARVTQLLDLTLLAPDIQEEILVAEVEPGRDAVTEHALRVVLRHADWAAQREKWRTGFGHGLSNFAGRAMPRPRIDSQPVARGVGYA